MDLLKSVHYATPRPTRSNGTNETLTFRTGLRGSAGRFGIVRAAEQEGEYSQKRVNLEVGIHRRKRGSCRRADAPDRLLPAERCRSSSLTAPMASRAWPRRKSCFISYCGRT